MITVFICNFKSLLCGAEGQTFFEELPPYILSAVDHYSDPLSRLQSAAGLLLLRHGAKSLYGYESMSIFRGEKGKPFFEDRTDIHFNISHTDTLAACAFSDQPIGIDIQIEEPGRLGLSRRVLNAQEQAWMDGLAEQDRQSAFFKLWTLKESVAKNMGTGVGFGLKRINVLDDTTVCGGQIYDLYHTYYNSICHLGLCAKTKEHIKIIEILPRQL